MRMDVGIIFYQIFLKDLLSELRAHKYAQYAIGYKLCEANSTSLHVPTNNQKARHILCLVYLILFL